MKNTKTKMWLKDEKKRGFTLIELMVVLAVIAVVASIAVPNFVSIRNGVNVKVDRQTCETIKSITRTYIAAGTIPLPTGNTNTEFNYDAENQSFNNNNTLNNTEYKDALSEVKQPQTAKDNPYEITITSQGKVTVKVSGYPNTSTDATLDGGSENTDNK